MALEENLSPGQVTNWSLHSPQAILHSLELVFYQEPAAEHYHPEEAGPIFQVEIPELEEDSDHFEDADKDIITHHNTQEESNRIRQEYSELFNNSPEEYSQHKESVRIHALFNIKTNRNPIHYYPPPPDPEDVRRWYGRGRAQRTDIQAHHLFGEKTRSLESRRTKNHHQNQRQRLRKLFNIFVKHVYYEQWHDTKFTTLHLILEFLMGARLSKSAFNQRSTGWKKVTRKS